MLGRITAVTTNETPTAASQTLASAITSVPYGGVASLTHDGGEGAAADRRRDRRSGHDPDRGDARWDHRHQTPAQKQAFTDAPAHRLATAVGSYGSYAWTYDPVGNRSSEKLGTVLSPYGTQTASNRLASIVQGTGAPRAFTYDASGDVITDSRSGGLGVQHVRPLPPCGEGPGMGVISSCCKAWKNTADSHTQPLPTRGRGAGRGT